MTTVHNLPPNLVRALTEEPLSRSGESRPGTGSLQFSKTSLENTFFDLRDLRLSNPPSSEPELIEVLDKLPAAAYVRSVLKILDKDNGLVVVGPTGSGKTTVIPLFVAAARPDTDVFVVGPRVLTTICNSEWLSKVCKQEVGQMVGYHTGTSKKVSSQTRLTFCTTGVAEMRELLRQNPRERIVFLDEAHERNADQDLLLAFLKKEMRTNPYLKVVVMSATIESERFSRYLGGVKVISIKGNPSTITEVEPEATLAEDVEKFVRQGLNIQVGLAGKLEIDQAYTEIEIALQRAGLDAAILTRHKDIPEEQQRECFRDHGMPRVILATNIAETSITIPDLDVVIDTGLRRRTYLNNGVQCLGTVYATQFEATQLRGRVGRTHPGIWVDRCEVPLSERPQAPSPELMRLQPTNAMLKFIAFQRIDPRAMELLDDPGNDVWDEALEENKELGLIDGLKAATPLGQVIARLPISVNLGRMLHAARQDGVLKEAILVAAAIEVNGIQELDNSLWRNLLKDDEIDSELVVQLRLFEACLEMVARKVPLAEFSSLGISAKNFKKANEHSLELIRRVRGLGWTDVDLPPRSKSVEHALVRAFLTGFPESVFVKKGDGFIGLDGEKRFLHGEAVTPTSARFIVGIPWDFNPTVNGEDRHTRNYINFASPVSETAAMKFEYIREILSGDKARAVGRDSLIRAPNNVRQARIRHGVRGRRS